MRTKWSQPCERLMMADSRPDSGNAAGRAQQGSMQRIFTDKLSGAQVERPGLQEALTHLREADTLVVWKLDRLGRSVKGLVDLVNEVESPTGGRPLQRTHRGSKSG